MLKMILNSKGRHDTCSVFGFLASPLALWDIFGQLLRHQGDQASEGCSIGAPHHRCISCHPQLRRDDPPVLKHPYYGPKYVVSSPIKHGYHGFWGDV